MSDQAKDAISSLFPVPCSLFSNMATKANDFAVATTPYGALIMTNHATQIATNIKKNKVTFIKSNINYLIMS